MTTLALGSGLIIAFLFSEFTGLLAGGLITPGYLALYFDQPIRIVATFAIAIATYGVVYLLSNFMVLYGRRKFIAMIITGFILGWALQKFGFSFFPMNYDIRVIGFIIPGLIANEASKQGILKTIVVTTLIAALVRLIIIFVR